MPDDKQDSEKQDSTVDNVLDGAADIATTSIHESGKIVSGAGDALKGDPAGGVDRIVTAAGKIASTAVHHGVKIAKDIAGRSDDDSSGDKPAGDEPAGDDAS